MYKRATIGIEEKIKELTERVHKNVEYLKESKLETRDKIELETEVFIMNEMRTFLIYTLDKITKESLA